MSALDMWFDGAFASASAALVSNPFDVMRTRMQLQGELCRTGEYPVVYRNLLHGVVRVGQEEGIRALQKGLWAAMCWQVVQNGIRIGLYPIAKEELASVLHNDGFGVSVAAGAACGVVGSYVSSPLVLVKTRLHSQRNTLVGADGQKLSVKSTGEQYAYRGVWDALRHIYREGGVRGLWHGSTVAAQRTMVSSAAQLVSYDYAKTWTCHYTSRPASDFYVHVIAATISSVFIVLFSNPLDVVMTRAYNSGNKGSRRPSVASSLLEIFRVEGVRGLYKGSAALFTRWAPHNIATFIVLEWLHKMREKYTNRAYTSGSTIKPREAR